MSEDLFARIISVDYEDYGSLHVKAVEHRDEDLFISLALTADEDPDLPENIRITCRSWRENTLVQGRYARVVLTQDHVLLWEYNQPQVLATFYGRVQDPLAVVGALFERHIDLAGTWIPFLKYLNPCIRLPELISGSFGMLAEGPETLVLAYEQVMSDYGVSVSHHQSAPEHFEVLSVLILDEAYVIGNAFFAEPT